MRAWQMGELESHAKALLDDNEYHLLFEFHRHNPMPEMTFVWTEMEWNRIKILARLTGCKCPHLVLASSLETMDIRRRLEGDKCERPFEVEELREGTTPRVKEFLAFIQHSHEQNDQKKRCHQSNGFHCYCDEHDHPLGY